MTDLKVQHVLTLANLISKGARHNFVPITTSSLGKSIHKSQQAASKHLLELEKNGFIERIMNGRKFSVKITSKGHSEMVKLSSILKSSLDSFPSSVELKGILVSGMGEGAFYMSLKGPTLSILSIAAAISAHVSISVLIGSSASPLVVFVVEELLTSILPTLETL